MITSTPKQEALQAINSLPDNANYEDIMYRLYVLDKIHAGMEDIKHGRVTTTEDLLKEIQTW